MSNVKDVSITATVPFCWMTDASDEDKSFMAGLFLSPSIGVKLEYTGFAGYKTNDNGGKTAMYHAVILGTEALSWRALDRLAEIIQRNGELTSARARDIEDGDHKWVEFVR